MKKKLLKAILLVASLSACNDRISLPEVYPTETKTLLVPSPTYTSTFTPTVAKAETLEALATRWAPKRVDDCLLDPDPYWSLPYNPNGISTDIWIIEYCLDTNTHLHYTRVIKRDGSISWIVPFEIYRSLQDYYDFMTLSFLSEDGKYAYFEPVWCCADGPGLVFINGWALYRLDLDNGVLFEVLPPSSYSWALSHDKKSLIYFDFLVDQLFILDLPTMGKIQVPSIEEDYNTGFFNWSPDSKKVIFVRAGGDDWWEEDSEIGFSLLLLDVDTMKITVLIENDERFYRPDFSSELGYPWIGNNSVILSDKNRNLYALDLTTKSLSPWPAKTPIMSPAP
jgi:hypothetical protein